jgi:hypothetical protein
LRQKVDVTGTTMATLSSSHGSTPWRSQRLGSPHPRGVLFIFEVSTVPLVQSGGQSNEFPTVLDECKPGNEMNNYEKHQAAHFANYNLSAKHPL